KGFEFTLGINIPMPKDMRWNWTFTGTHYKNKVTDIPEDKRESGITHSSYYNIREGRSVYDFYYYRYAGVNDEGKSLWYYDATDENGNVTLETTDDYSQADKYYIGTALPDFQGGITTEFAWKGLDFSISANYQLGGKIYDSMYSSLMHAGSSAGQNWHRDILNAWSETNKNSNIPVLDGDQNANTFSDRFLIGADYFNIRNITLGYTFPKNWLSAAAIENARLYLAADNVAIFSKRKGMDPRQYISGQSQANYSAIRTLSVGLSLTF
ncbi:MAG: SusC/RagA family TonB-linked outer membrane protein, partial [Bacteroides fragilis]